MITIDGTKYEEFDLRYWPLNENETIEEFENRYALESGKITHWLCKEGETTLNVTKGTIYEVRCNGTESNKDIFIIDESGEPSMVWVMLEGTFLIKS